MGDRIKVRRREPMLKNGEVVPVPPMHGDTGPVQDCPVCAALRKLEGKKRDKDRRVRNERDESKKTA